MSQSSIDAMASLAAALSIATVVGILLTIMLGIFA